MGKKASAGKNPANRNYKDTVFRMLFRDREHLLGLYNAVSGRDYTDPERLEIVTLENAVYMGMKSDLEKAVDKAVEECIREDILRKFLLQNRAEVKRLNKFSDEQFIQPRICAETSQILLIAEQNLKFCSRPQRKALRNGGKDEHLRV